MADTKTFVVEVGVVHSAPSVDLMVNTESVLRTREDAAQCAATAVYRRILDGIGEERLCSLTVASYEEEVDETVIATDYREDGDADAG